MARAGREPVGPGVTWLRIDESLVCTDAVSGHPDARAASFLGRRLPDLVVADERAAFEETLVAAIGDAARARLHANLELDGGATPWALDVSPAVASDVKGAVAEIGCRPATPATPAAAAEVPDFAARASEEALGGVALRLLTWPEERLGEAMSELLAWVAEGAGVVRAAIVERPEPGRAGAVRVRVAARWPRGAGRRDEDPRGEPRPAWLVAELQAGRWVELPASAEGAAASPDPSTWLVERGASSYLAMPCQPPAGPSETVLELEWETERGPLDARQTQRLVRVGELIAALHARHRRARSRAEVDRRMELLSAHRAEGYCEVDASGRLLAASRSLETLIGREAGALVGRHFAEFVHRGDVERVRGSLTGALAGQKVDRLVFRALHADGAFRWIEAIATATRGEDGRPILVSAMRDVSPRELERVTLVRRVELESLVGGLTRRFLAAEPRQVESIIEESLGRIAAALSAVRVRLVWFGDDGAVQPTTYQYVRPGEAERPPPMTREGIRAFPWSTRRILEEEILEVPDVAGLPAEAEVDRRAFEALGLASILSVSAVESGRVIAILTVHGDTVVEAFPEHEKRLLRVLAELYSGALRRLRSEVELRSSEERFRALAENMRDSICEIGEDGRILYASPSYASLLGGDQDALRGSDPLEHVHPEDRERAAALFRPGVHPHRTGTVYRARSAAGRTLFLESTARVFEGQDGRPHVVVATRDVTERERARATLNRQLELESRVAELSRFFVDLDVDDVEAGVASRLAVVAELAEAEHSWMVSFETGPDGPEQFDWWREAEEDSRLVPPRRESGRFPWSTRLISAGEVYRVPRVDVLPEEAGPERADMEARGVRSALGIPIMSAGRFVGFLGFESFAREIDWSQETVVLLRMAGEIFYSTLRRRRAAVDLRDSQAQLLQAQKMEAVGTLAGGIAHDFNNHLAVMLANARFVRQEVEAPEEILDAIEDFTRSADHCAQLTRSLLAFSRRSTVEVGPVVVDEVVRGVEGLVRPMLPRTIDLRIFVEPELGRFAVDRVQIQQVLVNLMVNARDAMPEGGPIRLEAVRARLEPEEAAAAGLSSERDYVMLSVEDAGVGMDEATLRRVFEPFYTTKKLGQGTGLGLAMAYGIVRESEGAITVESQPGAGSTFRVYLPAWIEDDGERGASASEADARPG